MFKQILTLSKKEIRLWAQRPGQWIVLFVVPLVFIYIFGTAFGGGIPTVTIYVVNEDDSDFAQLVFFNLQNADNLDVEELSTREQADARVGAGERMAALIIPTGFGDAVMTDDGAVLEVLVDPARDEQAKIVVGLANAAIVRQIVDAEVSRSVRQGMGDSMGDMMGEDMSAENETMLSDFMEAGMKGVIASQVKDALDDPLVNLDIKPASGADTDRTPNAMQAYVPGYSLMFAFFLVTNLAVTVVEEREVGTLNRLLSTPASRGTLLLGKMLPYFLLAVIQLTTIFFVSVIVFDLDIGNSPLALGLIIVGSAAAIAGMGIMIAALVKNEGQASGLTILLILGMAAISGCLSPNIQIPGISLATPHYWSLLGFQNVMARGMGYSGALLPAGILLAFAAVFFTIGVKRFKFD